MSLLDSTCINTLTYNLHSTNTNSYYWNIHTTSHTYMSKTFLSQSAHKHKLSSHTHHTYCKQIKNTKGKTVLVHSQTLIVCFLTTGASSSGRRLTNHTYKHGWWRLMCDKSQSCTRPRDSTVESPWEPPYLQDVKLLQYLRHPAEDKRPAVWRKDAHFALRENKRPKLSDCFWSFFL